MIWPSSPTSWLVLPLSLAPLAGAGAGSRGRSCAERSVFGSFWPFLFAVFFCAHAPSPFARFSRKLASCAGRKARRTRTHRSARPSTTPPAWPASGLGGGGMTVSTSAASSHSKTRLKITACTQNCTNDLSLVPL